MPLKHLSYVEATGQVRFSPPRSIPKVWEHAYDFLAEWVQHIPRARQHQVTYAGHFANALGNLNPKQESQAEKLAEKPKPGKWVKWRTLILRSWAVDPELCPHCQKEMKRAKALVQQHELMLSGRGGLRGTASAGKPVQPVHKLRGEISRIAVSGHSRIKFQSYFGAVPMRSLGIGPGGGISHA